MTQSMLERSIKLTIAKLLINLDGEKSLMSSRRPFDSRRNGRNRALANLTDHAPRPQTANWKGQFDGVKEGGKKDAGGNAKGRPRMRGVKIFWSRVSIHTFIIGDFSTD